MRRPAWIEITRAPADPAGGGNGNGDAGSGGEGGAGGGGGGGGTTTTDFDWAGNLGERHAEFSTTLTAKGWKSPAEVLTAYGTLEKESAGRIAIPGEGATDDERAAFYKALGRPDQPAEYGLAKPADMPDEEWDSERMERFATAAHTLGLSAQQAKGIIDWLGRDTNEQIAAYVADLPNRQKAHEEKLTAGFRKEYGAQTPEKLELARRAYQTFVGDADAAAGMDLLSEKIGEIAVMKMFATIGAEMGEARLRRGGGGGEPTPELAKAELTKLKADPDFREAFSNSSHPQHKVMVAKHNELAAVAGRARTT